MVLSIRQLATSTFFFFLPCNHGKARGISAFRNGGGPGRPENNAREWVLHGGG